MPANAYPSISIVTPSLNQGEFIENTILSVLSQDYPNLEYIVMDGGSSDNTLEVLKKYNERIKWVSEPDKGQTNAINKGLDLTHGSIFGYLNADDVLLPGTLQKVGNVFGSRLEVQWVTGQCRIINENNHEIRKAITIYKNLLLRFHSFPLLLTTNYISQPATFWRRDLMNEMGLLDEELHYVMDYEYWLRFSSKYPPAFIPEYLASFTIHTASKTTSSGHKDVYINEERDIIQRHTSSEFLIFMHNAHRYLMTWIYSLINRSK